MNTVIRWVCVAAAALGCPGFLGLLVAAEVEPFELLELEATVKVICFETEAYYVDKERYYRIKAVDTKKIAAARDGERRSFDFKTFKLQFDEDRDSSNSGGWKYRYWICYLSDTESGSIIQWKTSYDALQRHLEKFPEVVDKYLSLRSNAEVPTKFSTPVPKGVLPGKG